MDLMVVTLLMRVPDVEVVMDYKLNLILLSSTFIDPH